MSEPTLRDITRAAAWLHAAFGDFKESAGVAESLAFLIARCRQEEREESAQFCEFWARCNADAWPEQALAARTCAAAVREGRRPDPGPEPTLTGSTDK